MPSQVTWRADDELIDRAKRRAAELHTSLNGFLTLVVDTATNPEAAGSEAERLRERLAAAGLLAQPSVPDDPPPTGDDLADVRSEFARCGGPMLSDLIAEGRGG